ncbi:MAG: ribosomal-processing cysteine protease Prp [Clostridia bacterium]|nr:ribosomal-processing cysteine protease Prp [Clostridia bacterium]MBQ4645000.1 ribosomal-processing cysteine protease Prp [Clostridia bacterium]
MTTAKFLFSDDTIISFELSGHSGAGEYGTDIVCSAVSSAVYMAANTIIEIMKLNPQAEVRDGYLKLKMSFEDARKSKVITDGLYLHLSELQGQYPNNLKLERGVFDA